MGLSLNDARGAALTVFISRGEEVYTKFTSAVNELFNDVIETEAKAMPEFALDRESCLEYFEGYFGFIPPYVELMADDAPRALEGYVLMREFSLAENLLDAKVWNCCYVQLMQRNFQLGSLMFMLTEHVKPEHPKQKS
ncbi:MAG: hypothetical protein CM15mP49_06480 [Actinomycetota bacterium]|nr:MAG: hypothetical protein CM15mP49_06480 [Actinomycetota bacterium]